MQDFPGGGMPPRKGGGGAKLLFGQIHENEESLPGITHNFTMQIRDLSQKNKY